MARAKAKPGLAQLTPEEVAEMKKWAQKDADRDKYHKLLEDLRAVEHKIGRPGRGPAYLTDENIDHENLPEGMTEKHPDFWQKLHSNAAEAAAMRAEELGHDINKLIGRKIY